MTALPAAYADLAAPGVPRVVAAAVSLYGIREKAGAENNPVILSWWRELREAGLASPSYGDLYRADSIPWCGLMAAKAVADTGRAPPLMFLAALSWQDWGAPSPAPSLGDVLVFRRPGGGHVGFYAGEDRTCLHVLGGNQGDAVSIIRIARSRLVAARCPVYKARPASARRIRRAPTGQVSTNEA